jgi:metallophosphoesterase (TIGR00282 family)
MKILFCGDIVGRSGREAVLHYIPLLREKFKLDFVVVNGENAAQGFGITRKICEELYACGVDVVTTGNHIWDQKETLSHISEDPKLIRPLNFPKNTPGKGFAIIENAQGKKLMVVNVMGQLFMDSLDNPFHSVETLLGTYKLGQNVDGILVDIHAEANSEKMAMGHFLDGKVTLVAGTHTHVPTADHVILPNGTAYITDVGMTGCYQSVIGMDITVAVERLYKKTRSERLFPADGEGTLCGVIVESDDTSGHAKTITPVRLGGILPQTEIM